MIKVGDKVEFDHLKDIKIRGLASGKHIVTGTVIEVYPEHQWFAVEYFLGEDNTRLRTSFKFVDIGVSVFPCK
jgi:hypothetical protein